MLHSCHMLATLADAIRFFFSLTRIDRSPSDTFVCYIETFKARKAGADFVSNICGAR